MTTPGPRAAPTPHRLPRVLLADRGDPLTGPLSVAVRHRFDVVDRVDAELTRPERLLVAATTFRPGRRAWSERFHKSNLAVGLRSRRAETGLSGTGRDADVVLQTHALFETADPRTVLYLDCTHRQSQAQWPAWDPLRGRGLARWLDREHRQFHRAAHLFAFSQETARSLVEQYDVPPARVSVVGAGVTLPPPPARREPRTDRAPVVLFVGNDFERKGGPELLQAFALLRHRHPDAELRLVGTPYPVPAQDGVTHLGRVHDREAMSRLYAEADVFCLPAHFDPFPGALLEAMAHGLPCVVTPTCGVPEIVVEDVTALTVAPGAALPDRLADALDRLLRDPEAAASMGRQGRRRVEDRFLWSHVLDRMAPVLERLAAPTDAPTAQRTTRTPRTGASAPVRTTTPRGERP
ncbi:hypothetical protein GCM10023340_03340 [Nocardioides marinquilinus]|uniref:Glycosyl transferase family 1 domain-containing protein n=1 Tax=Nocardioides marinquilinus TaxID=1210400 RepID=A0ABP9PB68_9ACTN